LLVQKGLQIMETKKFTFRRSDVIIVGSGAAGLNAAIALKKQGIQDVTVLTEGLTFGTSRNTGSDKQTYYKLTSSGTTPDSVRQMAQTLFDGGCVDGDIALAEAAVSTRAFFHLVDIGVPFPCNRERFQRNLMDAMPYCDSPLLMRTAAMSGSFWKMLFRMRSPSSTRFSSRAISGPLTRARPAVMALR